MSDGFDQGITVTEIAAMDLPIDVAPETTAAFVGRALRGPLNIPILVESFAAFQRRFGGLWHRSSLAPAVKMFFEHGGEKLYVVRVANNARGAMLALPAANGVLVLRALEPGSTENIRAAVDYDGVDDANDQEFNLIVQRVVATSGVILDQEIFKRISCDPDAKLFVGSVLLNSELVRAQSPLPSGRPATTVKRGSAFETTYVGHAQQGTDGSALTDYDLIGSAAKRSGIFSLNQVEHFDLLYMPPPTRERDLGPAVYLAAEQYCRLRGALLVMDPPASWNSAQAALAGIKSSGYASPSIVGYFPRVVHRNDQEAIPRVAGAAIAGLLCKLDRVRGAWEDLDQHGFGIHRDLNPAVDLSIANAKQLVREGLNVFAGRTASRATLCGSVTLGRGSQMDRRFTSLTVRRLCLHITNAIDKATQWAVFETDAARVAERIHGQVDGFMSHLANRGAFADDHFVVQCDTQLTSNTSDPDRGVTILLAFRPVGCDEDVALTLHQTVAGCRIATTAFAPVTARVA